MNEFGKPPNTPTTPWARLRQMDRRGLGLLVLVPILVVVWLPLVPGKPAPVPPAAAPASPAAMPAAPLMESAMAPALPAGSPAAIARLGDMVTTALTPYEPRWRPPQMAPPRAIERTTPLPTPTSDADAAPELVPSAILLSPGGQSMAIVGGVPRAVGDDIGGHILVDIGERGVRYRRGAKDITVDLPDSGPRGNR